ncbi:MAG: sugar-binding protein [Propionibacteriaceae bacterium]|jgi:putative multiple sugar transport system substrate-binding protein|nr:sugar-binding protein [Propionibacteriaceae bacterium]
MKNNKRIIAVAAAFALAVPLALTGCSGDRGSGGGDTGSGFPADATVGVALPWLGTQNWAEANDMFAEQLAEAGFKPLVQQADNKVPQQQSQIEAMIEQGASVIVVGPVDGSQLGTQLEKAKEKGILIIGYDRLLENTTGVDAVVQYGSIRTGELQGQSLLEGLKELKGDGPYNIELFAGGPADPNAPNFFTGAMSVLQPKIDDGTLVVVSGQTTFEQAATLDWDNSKAQARMDTLLSGFYSDKQIDGVLSPNDGIARAILTACAQAGQDQPVVDGLDAENESIVSIWEGHQYSTTAKPTDKLVAKTIELIQAAQKGEALPEPTSSTNNGKIDVPLYELDPVIVTKANIKEVFADDPSRLELLK